MPKLVLGPTGPLQEEYWPGVWWLPRPELSSKGNLLAIVLEATWLYFLLLVLGMQLESLGALVPSAE